MAHDLGARLPGESALDGRSTWMPVGCGSVLACRLWQCPRPLGTAAPLADGCGRALACRIRCIDKLVCRKARCRRPTLRRVRRMRKRRMHFGGKRKTSYSLLAWTCAEPRSCGFFKSALARRPRPRWRWRGDLARSGAIRYNGRFPKSVGCSDACEARFADGRSVRSSA